MSGTVETDAPLQALRFAAIIEVVFYGRLLLHPSPSVRLKTHSYVEISAGWMDKIPLELFARRMYAELREL